MIASASRKLIVGVAIFMALLWSLGLGLVYAVIGSTDDVWRWVNGLVTVPPDVAHALSGLGTWLGGFSDVVLLVIWSLGLALIVGLAWLGRHFANLIPKLNRDGGLS